MRVCGDGHRAQAPLAARARATSPSAVRDQAHAPRGDLGLVRTAPVSTAPRASAAPFSVVQLDGLAAPVLVPGATTPRHPDPFRAYVRKLGKACAFPRQTDAIERLARVQTRPAPPRTDRPWVAIMISEPSRLLPGRFAALPELVESVRALGAEPILIPPMLDLLLPNELAARREGIASLAGRFHGIIGPGGADVHPRLYKERITHARDPIYPRDRFEAEFVTAALRGNAFLLGICRSHQLWNAATGGKLVQDVELEGLSSVSQDQDRFGLPRSEPFVVRSADGSVIFENRVELEEDSEVARLLGETSIVTNSLHHQAVAEPGAGFEVTGLVPDPVTGRPTIETTESWNAITTQFHPELMMHDPRFRRLVETVTRRAHVLFQADRLKAEGSADLGALIDRVRARVGDILSGADLDWLRERAAPRLALGS